MRNYFIDYHLYKIVNTSYIYLFYYSRTALKYDLISLSLLFLDKINSNIAIILDNKKNCTTCCLSLNSKTPRVFLHPDTVQYIFCNDIHVIYGHKKKPMYAARAAIKFRHHKVNNNF